MTDLERILKRDGPGLSGNIAATLASELGLTPEAARKRMERRPENVRVLDGMPFERGARFMFLRNEYFSPRFIDSLITAFGTGTYARAFAALRARGGIMPLSHFPIACGAPFLQTRQVAADAVRRRLVDAKLLEELEVPGVGPCIAFAKNLDFLETPEARMKARLIVEKVLLSNVKEWARRLNLGAYDSFEERDGGGSQPHVGTFYWDMTAPSYIGGLATWAKGQRPVNGFIAFDILLNGMLDETSLMPFVHKCVTLRSLRKIPRCTQYFIAEGYTTGAFKLARTHGIVTATPASLFGEDVARALVELATVLKGAATAAVDPAKFAELFERLGKAEGAAGTLRGALFEFVCADLARRHLHATRISMNKTFRENGQDAAEIDVLAEVQDLRVHFIECKGNLPGRFVPDAEVERWLYKRIPYLYKYARQRQPQWERLDLAFELWTTGELSAHATELIAKLQASASPRRYTVVVRQAAELERMARESGDQSLRDVLAQHFFNHPLADPTGTVFAEEASTVRVPTAFEFSARDVPALPLANAGAEIRPRRAPTPVAFLPYEETKPPSALSGPDARRALEDLEDLAPGEMLHDPDLDQALADLHAKPPGRV